jgi:hypothetical protein
MDYLSIKALSFRFEFGDQK